MLFRGAKAAFLSCVMAGAFFIPAGRAQTLPAEECTPEPVIAPIAATHVIPPYPQISVFANEEGVSVLKVIIDEQGDVADDTVYQSSGSVYLDNAALTFVKAKWKWKPPARNCKPATMELLVSVSWQLRDREKRLGPRIPYIIKVMDSSDWPPDALAKNEEGMTGLQIIYSEKGIPLGWFVMESSGHPDLDKLSAEIAMKRYQMSPMRLTGQPIKSAAYFAIIWKHDPQQSIDIHQDGTQ